MNTSSRFLSFTVLLAVFSMLLTGCVPKSQLDKSNADLAARPGEDKVA